MQAQGAGFGPEDHRAGWESATRLFQYLTSGQPLNPLPPGMFRLLEGERLYADGPCEHARFYGTDVSYQHNTTVAFGSPGFVMTSMAASALGNAAARRRAAMFAAPRWRDVFVTRVVLTNFRLMILWNGQWATFPLDRIVEFLPRPELFGMILHLDGADPLRLRGPFVPFLSVALARILYPPDQFRQIPAFQQFTAPAVLQPGPAAITSPTPGTALPDQAPEHEAGPDAAASPDQAAPEPAGAERAGSEQAGTERAGSEQAGPGQGTIEPPN